MPYQPHSPYFRHKSLFIVTWLIVVDCAYCRLEFIIKRKISTREQRLKIPLQGTLSLGALLHRLLSCAEQCQSQRREHLGKTTHFQILPNKRLLHKNICGSLSLGFRFSPQHARASLGAEYMRRRSRSVMLGPPCNAERGDSTTNDLN